MLAVKTEAGAKYLIDLDTKSVTRLSEVPLDDMDLACGFKATLLREDTLTVGSVVMAKCHHCDRAFHSSRIKEVKDDADT